MPYPTRRIGNTQVSAIGWGAMGISAFYGPVQSDEERFKVLDRAHELGITHWDSADVYADSEELIGKWFRRTGKRADIFLATKFGFTPKLTVNGTPAYAREAVDRSLARLGVDQIDLYYVHRVDAGVPIEDTVRAMAEFVKLGKVKYLGLSEPSSTALRRAHAVHPISAVQVEYSPFALDIEDPHVALRKTARELGIPIIAYSPLGRGMLTGKYRPEDFTPDDFRQTLPLIAQENASRVAELARVLGDIGARHSATAGQASLAWLLAQGDDVLPIPGTKQIKYLEENARAVEVMLTPEEVAAVRKAAEESGAKGVPRYSVGGMKLVLQDSPAAA